MVQRVGPVCDVGKKEGHRMIYILPREKTKSEAVGGASFEAAR